MGSQRRVVWVIKGLFRFFTYQNNELQAGVGLCWLNFYAKMALV